MAFEDFVNTELPKRIGFSSVPGSGNATAGKVPRFTGTGLIIEESTEKANNVIRVGSDLTWADYDNLPDALEAANQLSKDLTYHTVLILMDAGDYTIDRQITLTSSASALTSIVIQAYSPQDVQAGKYTSGDSVVASVRISIPQDTTSPVFTLSYISLEFRDVLFVSIPDGPGGVFTPADFAIFQGGGGTTLSLQNCHLRFIDVNFGVSTHHLQLIKGTGGAFRLITNNCYFYWFPIFSGDSGIDRYLINMDSATHSYWDATNCLINIAGSSINLSTDVFGVACLCNISNDDIPYYTIINNTFIGYFGNTFNSIFNIIYTNTNDHGIGQTVVKGNNVSMGPNDGATPSGEVRFLYVDSQANDAFVPTTVNTFVARENATGTQVTFYPYYTGTGDTIDSSYDNFIGILPANFMQGSGSFVYNQYLGNSKFTPTTLAHWLITPDTLQKALDYLAQQKKGIAISEYIEYTYNGDGTIATATKYTDSGKGTLVSTKTFTYNGSKQVTTEETVYVQLSITETKTYSYSGANLTSVESVLT